MQINSQQQQQPAPSTVIHDYWAQFITRNQELDGSEHGSSPRTPAEINSLGGMPNSVVQDSEGSIRSGGSPEMAQEAGEMHQSVLIHPLSPDIEVSPVNVSSKCLN